MALAKRPVQSRNDIGSKPMDDAAERFIQGAAASAPKPKRQNKEAVIMRFDPNQLAVIDQKAAALGLSRAAWVRMVVAQALGT